MNFNNFFANFDAPESVAILFFLIVAFLLGLLVGYLLRGRAVRRLKQELEKKQQELSAAQDEAARLQEELNLREADLRRAQFEAEENRAKVARLADEKTKLYNEVYTLNAEVENLKKAPAQDDSAQVAQLRAAIEQLNAQLTAAQNRNAELEATIRQLQVESSSDAKDTVDYLAEFQSMQNALRHRLENLEEKLSRVETENGALKTALQELRMANRELPANFEATASSLNITADEPIFNLSSANKAILMDPILRRPADCDDLTRISGVSPYLETKLNEAGYYTYEQIMQWDPSDVHQVTERIGCLPGQIEKEDWIGQAIQLAKNKQSVPDAFEARGWTPTDQLQGQDLKMIEGIGPRIEALLKEAGIHTWQELAETDADHLRSILDAAGEHFSIHDPTTWPAQARLAANGNWELLREYQEQLKGGREQD